MYHVYIVDDEKLIIESIIGAIEWLENGFELVGLNTDPQLAVEEIIAKKPDLIFCDLKMPSMNGIELIRVCKDKGVESEFIMLSAFAEFDASREFFLLDGLDYILKPVSKDNLYLVLDRASRKLIAKKPPTYKKVHSNAISAFDDIISYVNENFSQKHTLKSLSAKFFVSETYICDLFAKKLSTTFTVYILNLRMKKASDMILKSKKSMKEIGIDCGYSDYFYFCRVFKNFHGVPPGEYRKLKGNV